MPADPGAKRGCGDSRTEGGLYMEVGLSPHGLPLEAFLVDPPIPLESDQLASIPRVGVTLVDGPDGIVHVIDWVGRDGYPYAPDFLEEGRVHGFSRKVSQHLEVARLTPGKSMVHFVHPHGFLHNWRDYHENQASTALDLKCALRDGRDKHGVGNRGAPVREHCIRHLWAAVPPPFDGFADKLYRKIGDVEYRIYPADANLTPAYVPAFIAAMPITNFTVIEAEDGAHVDVLQRVRNQTKYPVIESEA